MIDLHCHFLPGIDDGAKTLADGLAMAHAAVADGITYSVMTPHIHPGRYENTRSSIEQAFKDFQLALRKARVPLHIGMAAAARVVGAQAAHDLVNRNPRMILRGAVAAVA